MNIRHAASLDEADSYVTNVAFPTTQTSSDSTNLWMMTASEDDNCRLYDLNNNNNNNSNPTFLRASYSFPEIGTHKSIFSNAGNALALIAPRNRAENHQIYGLDLETGQFEASYLIFKQVVVAPPPSQSVLNNSTTSSVNHTTPWFSSLVVHPTARGVFAASGENNAVFFCHAGISTPVARLSSINMGRSVVEFSPNGNLLAVGDRDNISIYDWRKMGNSPQTGPVAHFKVKEVLAASRWLSDVGGITGLHFHPDFTNEANAKKLLVTTSRYVVRTIDFVSQIKEKEKNAELQSNINIQQDAALSKDNNNINKTSSSNNKNVILQTFGASGAAASHLPNERPSYFAHKRAVPTAARFSPIDGRFVSCGSCMGRVTIFDAKSSMMVDENDMNGENNDNNDAGSPQAATLTHVLFGRHYGAVSVTEWVPTIPALVSTCRSASVWRFSK